VDGIAEVATGVALMSFVVHALRANAPITAHAIKRRGLGMTADRMG
jgi:hypothetical protein